MKNKLHGLRENKVIHLLFLASTVLFPIFLIVLTEFLSNCSIHKLPTRISLYYPGLYLLAILYAFFTLLCRRPWISALISGIPMIVLAICNFFKMGTLNEPILPSDLILYKKAGEMAGFVKGFTIPPNLYFGVTAFLLYVIFLLVFGKTLKINSTFCYLSLCIFLIISMNTAHPQMFRHVLSFFSLDQESTVNQNLNYRNNGLLGSFLINLNALNLNYDENYSAETVAAAMADYHGDAKSTDTDNFVYPDVIVILSEAFWDVNDLSSVDFSENPLSTFDALCEEGISGKMVSTTFGGGTVRPEFEVLTGLTVANLPDGAIPYEQYITKPLPSLASLFKGLGYDTLGLHTFKKSFYNRENAYRLMGFDAFYGMEDIPYDYKLACGYVADDLFATWMIDKLKATTNPQFIMGISMENHGPYCGKYTKYDVDITVDHEVDPITLEVFNNLTQGIYNADKALKKLTDYLRESDRPTVLLYFGDHLPFLESSYSGFVNGGFLEEPDSVLWTDQEELKMYSCPYLIWSNYIKEPQTFEYTSPYQLGAMMLDYIHAPKNDLYRFLDEYRKILPVSKSSYIMDNQFNRVKLNDLTEIQQKMLDTHSLLTYDALIAKNNYSVEK